jgi:hypothetical protein
MKSSRIFLPSWELEQASNNRDPIAIAPREAAAMPRAIQLADELDIRGIETFLEGLGP